MRRITPAVMCSIALLALGLGAASASAAAPAPVWAACAKVKGTGDYHSKTCSEPSSGGNYELEEGIGKARAFKGKGHAAKLTATTLTGSETVECSSSKSSGTARLPALETGVRITFKKCIGPAGERCTTEDLHPGEIGTNELEGKLHYNQESPPIIGLNLESETHPGPEGVLATFSCEGLEGTIKGSLSAVQTGDINVINKAFELTFSGSLQTELEQKGEALMVDTKGEQEKGGGGGGSVLIGEDEEPGGGGDATSGEVTPVLFAAKSTGTIDELKFEEGNAPEKIAWCTTLEVGVVEAKAETLHPYETESGGAKTTYPYTPGKLLESHSVACGHTPRATLSIPGFNIPIKAGVHYFLTFLPLGPQSKPFNGSRITYKFEDTEAVLFTGFYSGGNEGAGQSEAQKKHAIEEPPGLSKYEWWLERGEGPISIWAVGSKG